MDVETSTAQSSRVRSIMAHPANGSRGRCRSSADVRRVHAPDPVLGAAVVRSSIRWGNLVGSLLIAIAGLALVVGTIVGVLVIALTDQDLSSAGAASSATPSGIGGVLSLVLAVSGVGVIMLVTGLMLRLVAALAASAAGWSTRT